MPMTQTNASAALFGADVPDWGVRLAALLKCPLPQTDAADGVFNAVIKQTHALGQMLTVNPGDSFEPVSTGLSAVCISSRNTRTPS